VIDPLIAARALHFASTTTVTGAVFFQWIVAEPAFRKAGADGTKSARDQRRQTESVLGLGLALAIASGVAWIAALAMRLSGEGLGAADQTEALRLLLTSTRFGQLWIGRLMLAGLVLAFVLLQRQGADSAGWKNALAPVAAAGLMGSLAWSGHAAATTGVAGDVHRVADVLHLVACAAWLGGLLPLWLLLRCGLRQPSLGFAIATAAHRFSTLGVASVATLLATGLVNAGMLVDDPRRLLDTSYGELLTLKIALFLSMVAIAAYNRGRATPRLPEDDAMRQLARNALVEAGLGLVILTIVAGLGLLPPAAHGGMSMP
jgi:putative copper resistance protein D